MVEEENQEEKENFPLFIIKSENLINDKFQDTKFLGFFLKIIDEYLPFDKCLLTNYQAVNEAHIKSKKEIKIENNGSEKIIDMTKERNIFTNKTLDYICIEILEEENNLENDNFLRIDTDKLEQKPDYFNDKEVYIPQYPKNSLSSGKILSSEKNKITHNCSLTEDFLGLPLLLKDFDLDVFGIQKEYDENNKIGIAIPIGDIINDIKYQYCPLAFNDKITKYDLTDEVIEILKKFPKIEDNSLLSICNSKFDISTERLAFKLAQNLNIWELYENYQVEIANKFCNKTKIVFDSNGDSDTIINVFTKVYGKSNLAFYHSFTIYNPESPDHSDAIQSKDLIFLNGKIELNNDKFDFVKNDVFIYGNFSHIEDDQYDYTSFRNQYSSIFIKNKGDVIYVVFYRECSGYFDIKSVIRIRNNFMTNNIFFSNGVYLEEEEIANEQDLEKKFLNKVEEWFENLEITKKAEIKCNELIIYQIEE